MKTHIGFTVNRTAVYGLGTALVSLVKTCSNPALLSITILGNGLRAADKINLAALLQECSFTGELHFASFDAQKQFGHLPSLHGDHTAYGVLLLPEIIGCDKLLYLDADVLVQTDVHQLYDQQLGSHLIGAVSHKTVSGHIDQGFLLEKAGLKATTPYFNSGVLLINAARWRNEEATDRMLFLGKLAGRSLLSHDQTLLNAYCDGCFLQLLPAFNCLYPTNSTAVAGGSNGIIHYQGLPKPFSPLLSRLHPASSSCKQQLPQWWHRAYQPSLATRLRFGCRTWRSLLRFLLCKYRVQLPSAFYRLRPAGL